MLRRSYVAQGVDPHSVALFIVSPMIRKMLATAPATGPADKSEKAEPEPLPQARTVSQD